MTLNRRLNVNVILNNCLPFCCIVVWVSVDWHVFQDKQKKPSGSQIFRHSFRFDAKQWLIRTTSNAVTFIDIWLFLHNVWTISFGSDSSTSTGTHTHTHINTFRIASTIERQFIIESVDDKNLSLTKCPADRSHCKCNTVIYYQIIWRNCFWENQQPTMNDVSNRYDFSHILPNGQHHRPLSTGQCHFGCLTQCLKKPLTIAWHAIVHRAMATLISQRHSECWPRCRQSIHRKIYA